MTLKEEIIQEKQTIRIDKIGFTTAEPFDSLKESLEEQKQLAILLALNIKYR